MNHLNYLDEHNQCHPSLYMGVVPFFAPFGFKMRVRVLQIDQLLAVFSESCELEFV